MQEPNQNVEIYENEMQMYLSLYCEEQGIEDIRAASQSVWNSALYYIYKHVFKNTDKLKSKKLYKDNNNPIQSNHNSYDYDIVLGVLDIYIYEMCMRYNKEVSIVGFSTLTGITRDTLYGWGNNETKLSQTSSYIFKKLYDLREESLVNKLVDMKHPTGPAIILNKQYGYNVPGVSREASNRSRVLGVSDLPRLDAKIVQIAQNDNDT